jgi:hypothetical protein
MTYLIDTERSYLKESLEEAIRLFVSDCVNNIESLEKYSISCFSCGELLSKIQLNSQCTFICSTQSAQYEIHLEYIVPGITDLLKCLRRIKQNGYSQNVVTLNPIKSNVVSSNGASPNVVTSNVVTPNVVTSNVVTSIGSSLTQNKQVLSKVANKKKPMIPSIIERGLEQIKKKELEKKMVDMHTQNKEIQFDDDYIRLDDVITDEDIFQLHNQNSLHTHTHTQKQNNFMTINETDSDVENTISVQDLRSLSQKKQVVGEGSNNTQQNKASVERQNKENNEDSNKENNYNDAHNEKSNAEPELNSSNDIIPVNDKQKQKLINQREADRRSIFEADKKTYFTLKKEIENKLISEEEISSLFRPKYLIFKVMDRRGTLSEAIQMINNLSELEPEYKVFAEMYYDTLNEWDEKSDDIVEMKKTLNVPYNYHYMSEEEKVQYIRQNYNMSIDEFEARTMNEINTDFF